MKTDMNAGSSGTSTEPQPEGDQEKAAGSPAEDVNSTSGDNADDIFSEKKLDDDSDVSSVKASVGGTKARKTVTVTSEDKKAFVDSVVSNTRFTKEYSLFGGRIMLVIRSLTVDEVNAIASFVAKAGTMDPSGLMAGRYRKYLAAAQVAQYNGVEMPPLEEPLFPRLESDGKTVSEPGWVDRNRYWDGIGIGAFNVVMSCISDFDETYATLCREADNSNFWAPDTP